jgi:hypothetical protein
MDDHTRDHIRTAEADRERVAARLREHFAQGRLTADELDERIAAALSATTFGDLRRTMADLPEPGMGPAREDQPGPPPHRHPWRGGAVRGSPFRRGPRILPLVLIALILALVIPGAGWLFIAFIKVMLVLWLVACLAGLFAVLRFRRHVRRWRDGFGGYRNQQHGQQHRHWHQYE